MGQAPIPPTPTGTTLTGKTIIITGGNAGLGFEAARQFLTLGAARLILACRSVSRGEEAASALRADPTIMKSNPKAVVEVFELDLDDYQSGLDFANRVKKEVKQLDILLNNGGICTMRYEKSKSGHERSMQGNITRKGMPQGGEGITILTT
jgi:retinol dehydrogenase-14